MFSLAYSLPLTMRQQLTHLGVLRERILCVPLSHQQEFTLRWQTTIDHMHGSFALAQIRLNRREIERLLEQEGTRLQPVVSGYKKALDEINDMWTGNPGSPDWRTIEKLTQTVYARPFSRHAHGVRNNQKQLQKLLEYLDTQQDQPVIQAGVALGFLSASLLPADDPGFVSRLLAHLYLAKQGLDVRGFAAVERIWAQEESRYHNAIAGSSRRENLTEWLIYFVDSIEKEYTRLLAHLDELKKTIATRRFIVLTNRQRAILHLVDNPDNSLTNRYIQERFHISQITASRELTRLTLLGLLTPHGKGRSVSYTLSA